MDQSNLNLKKNQETALYSVVAKDSRIMEKIEQFQTHYMMIQVPLYKV